MEHISMLQNPIRYGADPKKPLRNRRFSVLTDIAWDAEKASRLDTEYRLFLHACREMMATPDQAA